jgi:hypothetical protein
MSGHHIEAALLAYGYRPPLIIPPVYRVSIPPTFELININRTKGGRWVKGPKVKALRGAAKVAATEATIPRMTRARVICHVTRDRLGDRWDPANWYPSAKACVDGFTDAGLWSDDSVRHVLGPDLRGVYGVKCPPHGRLEFTIIDLSEGGSHGGANGWDV